MANKLLLTKQRPYTGIYSKSRIALFCVDLNKASKIFINWDTYNFRKADIVVKDLQTKIAEVWLNKDFY